MDLGSMIGGAAQAAASAWAVKQQIKWERERAQNAHQWEVKDLQAAGLNPIISAGGQGAATGGINAPDMSGIGQAGQALTAVNAAKQQKIENEREDKRLANETAQSAASVANTNADTINKSYEQGLISAKTAHETAQANLIPAQKELTAEKILSEQYNRQGFVEKQIATPIMRHKNLIENAAEKIAQKIYDKTEKQQYIRPKKKKHEQIFKYNNMSYQ